MQTSRNVFIVNLAVSQFLLALIVYPFLWVPSKAFLFPYGRVLFSSPSPCFPLLIGVWCR